MAPKALLVAASAVLSAAYVSAQANPNYNYFPKACASQCSNTIEVAYLCQQQYTVTTDTYACFCSSLPSDISTCASCLNSNDAAALANLITANNEMCSTAMKTCFFECSFDTCPNTGTAKQQADCACQPSYLQNIYNCGSCNTKNGNTQATTINDFNALDQSCIAQSYAGSNATFTTEPQASATGQNAYVAPTLTATGGGEAATGDLTAVSSTASGTGTSSAASGTGSRSASSTGTRSSGAATSSGASAASAAGSSASASPTSGAMALAAPALGGLLGLAGAMAALF